ncbi:MAG TPA: hypothetical protein VN256_08140 [Pyrinomonadaceae bacterium]|nr:hypothetical protein [Pyrinomonadaceae bacterium]
MRRDGRVDANQPEIVSALVDGYFSVAYTTAIGGGFPDLVVGGSMPCPNCSKKFRQNKLVEVKTLTGTLTKEQQLFHPCWAGQLSIARTIDDALKIVGLIK